jgi:predicted PurR-regulated permease PerM
VIRGQLLTAITQAIVAGIIFWMTGIPVPILFAVVLFFTTLIPVLGAATVWVPLVLYLLSIQQHARAAVLFIFGLLVISLLDNVIKPAVIGEKTRLPYFLLFFGILGGLKIYGFMGIFLAPVVLSLFFALIRIYQERNW